MAEPIQEEIPAPTIIVTEPPKFDLESYISNYDGITRLSRLITIGRCSTYLGHEALRAALAEAKRGKNVERYMDVVLLLNQQNQAAGSAGSASSGEALGTAEDLAWVDVTKKRIKAETERLEVELKGYKNNLIKESIRMGNEDLGAFYYDTGDYAESLKAYNRMREYCTTPKHISEMSLRLILVGVARENWLLVQTNVQKIRLLNLKAEDKAKIDAGLSPVLGLAQMARGDYKDAALSFLESDPAYLTLEPVGGVQPNKQVLSPNDVAIYGGLCALASMDRAELQANVLANTQFRNFLELEPHMRRAVSSFCSAKYTACLEILEAYRPDSLLDIYLQRHVAALYGEIRRKSIVEYFRPYSRVGLAVMADTFKVSEDELQRELIEMIRRRQLAAQIDIIDRVLLATSTDRRAAMHDSALEMAKDHEKHLRLKLLKINMVGAGLEVRMPKQNDSRGPQRQKV